MSFREIPIIHDYTKISDEETSQLLAVTGVTEIVAMPGIIVDNVYYRNGVAGTDSRMFARVSVAERLGAVKASLPGYDLLLFDIFRSTAAQRALFRQFFTRIKACNPGWSHEALMAETRKFVSNPEEKSRFSVSPHNSGGAVDLSLSLKGELLEMGTGFDEVAAASATDFFEQSFDPAHGISEEKWLAARGNRRQLFHAMRAQGFVNYREEWWHFDLGDCIWAAERHAARWYRSMEDEVLELCAASIH